MLQKSMCHLSVAVILSVVLAGIPSLSSVRANVASGGCWGVVHVSSASVPIGGSVRLFGSGYSCTTPAGGLLRQAAFILYRPELGFHVYSVPIQKKGTYNFTATIPRTLLSVQNLNGHVNKSVQTKPGLYYIAVRLFDVSLPPIKQADARVTLTR